MTPKIALMTLGATLLLTPLAWWQEDLLIVGLAGLIPFFAGRHSDKCDAL